MEQMLIPDDIDYHAVSGLRLEAAEKLSRIRPRNIGGEKYNAVRHCLWNYFILLVLNLLFILAPIRLMGVRWDVSRWIFLSVTGLFYLVALFREAQILSSVCNGLRTILYLCALELVPAVVLVVPAVLV